MKIDFRGKLLLVFAPVIALALATTVLLSWQSARATVEQNAARSLRVAEQIFVQVLEQSHRQLSDRVALLAEDFGFRRAIATGERETIISVLANHGGRANADLMLLIDPAGEVIASTHEVDTARTVPALLDSPDAKLMFSESGFYQVAIAPVRAPDLIAWVIMGTSVDLPLIQRVQQLALTDVALFFDQPGGDLGAMATGTDFVMPQAGMTASELSAQLDRGVIAPDLLAHTFTLDTIGGEKLYAVMSNSLSRELAAWKPWQQKLWLIGLVSLLVTALTAWVVARSVTRPITLLVQTANNIADGHYEGTAALQSDSEFGFLEKTLQNMGRTVRDREAKILHQARYDALTDLPTRQYLSALFNAAQTRASSVLLIKVRKVRQLTEVYGMDWTDQLLIQMAQRLRECVGHDDVLARIARDQFVWWAPGGDFAVLQANAAVAAAALGEPVVSRGIEVKLDLRLSGALAPDHGSDIDELLRRAVIALSRYKAGATEVQLYEDGQDLSLLRKLRVTQRLQQAIVDGAFELHYQPKLNLELGKVDQVEALLRWTDPELGRVFPDEFIPLAENSGDILPLGQWVTREAARQAALWKARDIDVKVGLNVSGRDFARPDFVEQTLDIIESEGVSADDIVLEVTESAMMEDIDQAIGHLERLRASGFTLALDDFGTGFSSLSQLKRLPVHELKIDKSFVLTIDTDEQDLEIVRSTIELGHNLALKVVAEGVESFSALKTLQSLGCDAIQGYYLSKPQPAAAFGQWWAQHARHINHAFHPEASQHEGDHHGP